MLKAKENSIQEEDIGEPELPINPLEFFTDPHQTLTLRVKLGEPVPPEQASNPSPTDGATGVRLEADLSWTAGVGADYHDVYFGTNPMPGPDEFKGRLTTTTFDPGLLQPNTTYYWRIDEVNDYGITEGTVWNFTTLATASYNPSSVIVHTGSIVSGDHTNLQADDESYLQIRSAGWLKKKVEWVTKVTINEPPSLVTKLRITYDGHYSASETQELYLYNYTSAEWDLIDMRTVGTSDVTIIWLTTDPNTIQDYISSTGEIKLGIRAVEDRYFTTFDCYGDYVEFYIEYTP